MKACRNIKKNLEEINSKIQNDKKMNYKLNKELQVWGIIEYNLSQYLNRNEKKNKPKIKNEKKNK